MFKKDLKLDIKAVNEDGTFEGLLSIYGVMDLGNDVVVKGAFTKTIAENRSARKKQNQPGDIPMLWQHKSDHPIGTLELIDTDEGLAVKGQFHLDVQQAREAYSLVKAGVIRGLSIGYDAIKKDFKDGVRYLQELRLWEGSVVTFPMLPMAHVTAVKEMSADFATVLENEQTFLMRMLMKESICHALDSIVWDSKLTDEEKIAASDDSIQQFREAYVTFLPKLFAAWESYKSTGNKQALVDELKRGARNSAADAAILRAIIEHAQALLGEEAAEPTAIELAAGKGTSTVGAASSKPDGVVPSGGEQAAKAAASEEANGAGTSTVAVLREIQTSIGALSWN